MPSISSCAGVHLVNVPTQENDPANQVADLFASDLSKGSIGVLLYRDYLSTIGRKNILHEVQEMRLVVMVRARTGGWFAVL